MPYEITQCYLPPGRGDVMDADSEAVDGYPFIADWNGDINLAAVGVQIMTPDQLVQA